MQSGCLHAILESMAFHVRAVNTALDSENKIHDDSVAHRYGFRGGLVPGVTVYGYLAAAVCEHFGPDWLERGAMDVRFREPLYHDEDATIHLHPESEGRLRVESRHATATAWLHQEENPRPLESESPLERKLPSRQTLEKGTLLGSISRSNLTAEPFSAPLAPELHGRVHPAILLSLANRIFVENYELGPWIHAASEIRKFGSAKKDDTLTVRARVDDLFERKGHEFVVLNVDILNRGRAIEQVRHTAIWRPRFVA